MHYSNQKVEFQKHFSQSVLKYSSRMTYEVEHFGFSNKAIHTSQKPEEVHGSVTIPIHLTSTFAQKGVGELYSQFDYARCGNPTRQILQEVIADLEYAKYGQVFSSGVAALQSFISMFQSGDHIICSDDVYGGTQRFLRQVAIKNYKMEVDFIDMCDLSSLSNYLKPNTRVIWIETPTNPTLKICDIKKICEWAKENGIISVVDNTFCSPVLQSPILLGADFVTNSATKYIGGHADIIMGTMTTNNKELNDRLYFNVKSLGAVPSPFDCYLAVRSLKTLKLRIEQHCKNAMIIADFLDQHSMVEKVIYPGLKSHPQHEIAKLQMRGFGGMITFYLKADLSKTNVFSQNLKVFILAESLGGVESLAEVPSLMTHASVPKDQRILLGIEDNMVRISVGIEDVEVLLQDLEDALKAIE